MAKPILPSACSLLFHFSFSDFTFLSLKSIHSRNSSATGHGEPVACDLAGTPSQRSSPSSACLGCWCWYFRTTPGGPLDHAKIQYQILERAEAAKPIGTSQSQLSSFGNICYPSSNILWCLSLCRCCHDLKFRRPWDLWVTFNARWANESLSLCLGDDSLHGATGKDL